MCTFFLAGSLPCSASTGFGFASASDPTNFLGASLADLRVSLGTAGGARGAACFLEGTEDGAPPRDTQGFPDALNLHAPTWAP